MGDLCQKFAIKKFRLAGCTVHLKEFNETTKRMSYLITYKNFKSCANRLNVKWNLRTIQIFFPKKEKN